MRHLGGRVIRLVAPPSYRRRTMSVMPPIEWLMAPVVPSGPRGGQDRFRSASLSNASPGAGDHGSPTNTGRLRR